MAMNIFKKIFGKKEPESAPKPAQTPAQPVRETPAQPVQETPIDPGKRMMQSEKLYVLCSDHTGTGFPFLNVKGFPMVFTDAQAANGAVNNAAQEGMPGLTVQTLSNAELDRALGLWTVFGIAAILFFDGGAAGQVIRIAGKAVNAAGMTEPVDAGYWVNARLCQLLLRVKQHPVVTDTDNSLRLFMPLLPGALRQSLYLVPMCYDGEPMDLDAPDDVLHTTAGVSGVLKQLSEKENSRIHTLEDVHFFGAENCRWAGEKDLSGKIMRYRSVVNPRTRTSQMPAFTNLQYLRQIFPRTRVAVVTFADLCHGMEGTQGIVIDPNGLCYEIPANQARDYADPAKDSKTINLPKPPTFKDMTPPQKQQRIIHLAQKAAPQDLNSEEGKRMTHDLLRRLIPSGFSGNLMMDVMLSGMKPEDMAAKMQTMPTGELISLFRVVGMMVAGIPEKDRMIHGFIQQSCMKILMEREDL